MTPDGPADKAGVKPDDLIYKINGRAVNSSRDLTDAVTTLAPGSVVTLDINRDGKPVTVRVTLAERPNDLTASARQSEAPRTGCSSRDLGGESDAQYS